MSGKHVSEEQKRNGCWSKSRLSVSYKSTAAKSSCLLAPDGGRTIVWNLTLRFIESFYSFYRCSAVELATHFCLFLLVLSFVACLKLRTQSCCFIIRNKNNWKLLLCRWNVPRLSVLNKTLTIKNFLEEHTPVRDFDRTRVSGL